MPRRFTPTRTIVTSFTPRKPESSSAGDFILHLAVPSPLAPNPSPSLACAISNGEIQVYDQESLHLISSFLPDSDSFIATEIVYGPKDTIIASGQDGTLSVRDLRSGNVEFAARLPSDERALSVSVGFDGYIAAVASDKGLVHFFDLRSNGNLLGSYVDAHTDEVTKVRFLPHSSYLLSAAEDGLVCLFDTTQTTEELAVKSVLNIGASPRNIGFCGGTNFIYCLSGNESLSIWNGDTATCVKDFGDYFRRDLGNFLNNQMQFDYLVDAKWNNINQELHIMAGNNQGDASTFVLSGNGAELTHQHSFVNGHRGVIRNWGTLSTPGLFMTAGEDARLCEWNTHQSEVVATKHLPTPIECGQGKRRSMAVSPPDRVRQRQRLRSSSG